ncbi:gluconokinase [Nocardia xishanensis]|uniref:gluconokinase n=1 Tax=Nocardia xishanensis TaxID=238964 RepID=UPI003F541BF0
MTHAPVPRVVVMGVSGAGKSTIGGRLAHALGVPFAEGDDFHPPANVAKMRAGEPLTDADRVPWLDSIAAWLGERAAWGGVVSCSALKRDYRDRLRATATDVLFLHLTTSREELARRMSTRRDHFMPASLLDSQLDTLEPLGSDERGIVVDATRAPADLVRETMAVLVSAGPT